MQGFTLVVSFLTVTATLDPGVCGAAERRPNVLIVLTDDQGYADLGCFGSSTNKTPRLDLLASEGMRFTSFYAQHTCGPSRSALLTGRYPFRSKGWAMPAEEVTIAELLRDAGYQTACIGKWDVSSRRAILDRMPNAQGFGYFFGTLGANDDGVVKFHENDNSAGESHEMGSLTRLYTDKAIDWLRSKRDPGQPFFLYVAHTMAHTIIDASDRFRGASKGGLYGDVVEELDYETGRLLDVVDELGLRDNTLVIYTTDNGPWNQPAYTSKKKGHPEGSVFWGDSGPFRNGKGSCYEGGLRTACIVRWPGNTPAGGSSDAIFATIDLAPTIARLAGCELPTDRVIDGVDQTALITGESPRGARSTFCYTRAYRKGKWKYLLADHCLYEYAREPRRPLAEELYDLEADLGETNNVIDQHPAIAAELRAELQTLIGDRESRYELGHAWQR